MTDLSFTEEQRDCLQELINVAMGLASDKLARFLNTFVHLQVPAIGLVSAAFLTRHRGLYPHVIATLSVNWNKQHFTGNWL